MSTTTAPLDVISASPQALREITHWIDGRRVSGTSGRSANVYNPATGQVQATVPLASNAELDAAVESSLQAFPAWAAQPPLRRARVLFRFRELFEAHIDDIAALITSEHGKVLSDAKGEATRGLEVVEFANWNSAVAEGRIFRERRQWNR